MSLKVLSKGFLKTRNGKSKFEQITIKILGRPCLIAFSPPESMSKFKQLQNNEPQLIIGNKLDIDCSNIKIPKVPPREPPYYHTPMLHPGVKTFGSHRSIEAMNRTREKYKERYELSEQIANDKNERAQAKYDEALAKFEERVRNAEAKIEAKKQEIREKFKGYVFYIYKGNLYYFNIPDIHSQEDQKLLIKKHYVKEMKKLEKFQKELEIIERLASKPEISREPIPESVRMFVWRRDGGKCVKCGTKENLEFDHIIPVSKGGSNTERNIQILCEQCNREKSDKI